MKKRNTIEELSSRLDVIFRPESLKRISGGDQGNDKVVRKKPGG